jgi:hypothetical protein
MGACKQIDLRSSVGQRTLTSAEEQSYLVMYPRNASSTLAEPSTSMKPGRCLTHGMSCASMYEKTMRSRAWMFCNARSCVAFPPSERYLGTLRSAHTVLTVALKVSKTAATIGSMLAAAVASQYFLTRADFT